MQRKTTKAGKESKEDATPKGRKPTWKKVTPGKLYPFTDKARRGERVAPDGFVQATAEELGKYVSDFELHKPGTGDYEGTEEIAVETESEVKAEGGAKSKAKKLKASATPETYSLKPVKDTDLFDVVSSAGKKMNEKPLDAESAEELKEILEEETEQE